MLHEEGVRNCGSQLWNRWWNGYAFVCRKGGTQQGFQEDQRVPHGHQEGRMDLQRSFRTAQREEVKNTERIKLFRKVDVRQGCRDGGNYRTSSIRRKKDFWLRWEMISRNVMILSLPIIMGINIIQIWWKLLPTMFISIFIYQKKNFPPINFQNAVHFIFPPLSYSSFLLLSLLQLLQNDSNLL